MFVKNIDSTNPRLKMSKIFIVKISEDYCTYIVN